MRGTILKTAVAAACSLLAGTALPGASPAGAAHIVFDPADGTVLQADEPNRRWHPASLTKVMTLYMVFEAIQSGALSLDDTVPVSAHAAAQPPTKLGLRKGRAIKLEDAINAVIVRSANDAAVVLAEAVAGSEFTFAEQMTLKARALGMTRSRFVNASGLPDSAQVTTARDMALLAQAMLTDFPQYYHYFSKRGFSYRGKRYGTINGWLTSFQGADGLKTGFTCGSGYNYMGSAVRGNRRLIGVVLGGKSRGERDSRMTRIMSRAFKDGDAGPSIAELANLANTGADAPTPYVLPRKSCGSTKVGALTDGKLPGWGINLGAYSSESEARSIAKRSRAALKSTIGRNRTALIPSGKWGVQRHSVLLVGLQQEEAGRACKVLWDQGIYCLALPPKALNDPKAVWR